MSSEIEADSGLTEEEKKQYAQRLMKMHCTCGTVDNYVNIPKDHGVVAGSDQQPLLNANDHVAGKNIIHFGKCKSDKNPERLFRKSLFGGGLIADLLETTGIMSFDCKPKTDEVWVEVNERNILDGAPAVLMGSCLTCRYGGTITFVRPDAAQIEQPADGNGDGDGNTQEVDYVKENTDALIAAAMEKIAATGDEGEASVREAQMSLVEAAALPANEAQAACSNLASSFGFSSAFQWSSALMCTDQQRAENFAHNAQLPFEGEFLDSRGMIIDQGGMSDFRINSFDVSQAGCGAVAAYNVCRLLNPGTAPSFPEVVRGMDRYGILNNTYGMMPAGLAGYLLESGMQVSCEVEDLAGRIGEAGTGVLMYVTDQCAHYVTCAAGESGELAFYNLPGETGREIRTFEEFDAYMSEEDALTVMALTVSKGMTEE